MSPHGGSGWGRLATRGSPLARHQAEQILTLVRRAHPDVRLELDVISTRGDALLDVPLDRIGGQGMFVKEVQAAVLDGRARLAVHSAKDLPPVTPDGLVLAAVPVRGDPRDVLVGRALGELGPGDRVATGSVRRRAQLANIRPDLIFRQLRGNMATRLNRATDGSVEAVVTSWAALDRLAWTDQIAQVLPPSAVLPQAGQGALAVECRADDAQARALLADIDDALHHRCVKAERALLATLGGSCSVPFGALAVAAPPPVRGPREGGGPDQPTLRLAGMMASGDGRIVVRAAAVGPDPARLGRELGRTLVHDRGATLIEGVDRESW